MNQLSVIRLSVIIPVYNVELYLEECLESIANQTEKFYEVILVNDGSTDQSEEICKRYCEKYTGMRLISQANKGLGAARNAGMKQASGDYIVFVDSDDYISLDMNETLRMKLQEHAVDVLYFNASIQYDIATREKGFIHAEELNGFKMTGSEYLCRAFPESYFAPVWLAAYRTCFLRDYTLDSNLMFSEGVYFEDNLFSLQAALEAQSVYCIPDEFYIRRCRADSIMTGSVSEKKCADMVSVQYSMWKYLQEKEIHVYHSDLVGKFVSAGVLGAVEYIAQTLDPAVRQGQMKKLLYNFFDMWMPLFCKSEISFSQNAIFLTVLREIQTWNEEEQLDFLNIFWDSREQYLAVQQELMKKLRTDTAGRLRELPMGKKGCRAGIYGTGRHTQALLKLYSMLTGTIQCELYFIVTEKTCDQFLNRPVIAVSECRDMVDVVIVSSRAYQQEMKESLINKGMEEEKVILLYGHEDVCDLITVSELLC